MLIVDRQQIAGWGKSVVEQLAQDIQAEFTGISGFSTASLWRMRAFHLAYAENPNLAPLAREIGWTHNLSILEKCKDDLEREFYLRMTQKFGWTKNVLIHQIENQTYQKTLLNQTNFDNTLTTEITQQAKLAIKDEYTFDFLELGDAHSERQLEQAILSRVEPFLQEMGGMFTFVGSQYRLTVAGQEYFLDLLLYHRHLKCLIAIELKVGEFLPEYVGKMQFYLAVLDDTVRLPDENPSIGIILCKTKDRTIVEYTLRQSNKPIGVTTYQIVSTLPQEFQGQLPDPTQIAQLLAGIN
jgi:predicted nuclease of restriction endonuclease-like (RecB) superfamily